MPALNPPIKNAATVASTASKKSRFSSLAGLGIMMSVFESLNGAVATNDETEKG